MYIFDHQHFLPPADPHQHDRLPQPVRERESHGDRRPGDRGDSSEYGGSDCVLQSDGQEAEGVRLSAFIDEFPKIGGEDLERESIYFSFYHDYELTSEMNGDIFITYLQMEEDMSTLFTRMKAYRERLSMSQNELAERVGVRRETIVRLEKGQYNPSLKLAMDISKVFQTTVEDMFIFTEESGDISATVMSMESDKAKEDACAGE